MLLLALLACATGKNADDTAVAVDCSTRPLDLPGPRGEVGGAWDDTRKRLVIFGGDQGEPVECSSQPDFVGETWAWETDCGGFADLTTDEGPPPRGRFASVGDEGHLYIHGGRWRETGDTGRYTLYDDLWAFDYATDTWTLLAEEGPGERSNHTLVVAGRRLLLFGGNDSTNGASFSPLDDTWSFDLDAGTWEPLDTTGDPVARLFHAAVVTDDGRTMYVYGGGDEGAFTGPFFADLQALDLDTLAWSEVHGSRQAPDARIWANLAWHDSRLYLFGGHDDGALGNTNQVWTYQAASDEWDELLGGDVLANDAVGFCDFPANFVEPDLASPERRDANVGVMDPDGQLWIFGGKTDCGIINDVWSFSSSSETWTEESPATSGEICLRAYAECETMCF